MGLEGLKTRPEPWDCMKLDLHEVSSLGKDDSKQSFKHWLLEGSLSIIGVCMWYLKGYVAPKFLSTFYTQEQ